MFGSEEYNNALLAGLLLWSLRNRVAAATGIWRHQRIWLKGVRWVSVPIAKFRQLLPSFIELHSYY